MGGSLNEGQVPVRLSCVLDLRCLLGLSVSSLQGLGMDNTRMAFFRTQRARRQVAHGTSLSL